MKNLVTTLTLLLAVTVFAAEGASQPMAIAVEAISFAQTTNPEPRATLVAKGPTGETLTYTGDVVFQFPDLAMCTPCNLPRSFDAGVLGQTFAIKLADDYRAVVTITQSTADPIVVSPRLTWRDRSYSFIGNYAITASVEVTNGLNTTAISQPTTLNGNYLAELFISKHPNGRRIIQFRRIMITMAAV